jgi:hypothetical protein
MSAALTRAALLASLLASACAPLPTLIREDQVRAVFDPSLHGPALLCAARLNDLSRNARAASIARPVLSGAGALLGGVSLALNEVAPEASLPLAATGATLGILAELLLRVIADPATLLTLRADGFASWLAARQDPDAAGYHLLRCEQDLPPPRAHLPSLNPASPAP